jgi:alkylhydroperoxidase family enzyme
MRPFAALLLGAAFGSAGLARADEAGTSPRPVPLTRPEVKQYLEDMKDRKPRIPLPELTDEDRKKLGDRADNYEMRLRYHYMPGSDVRGGFGFSRDPDPNMTLDYPFKTELFWIVSRTNNCQYCLGHQEMKLAVAGRKEEQVAALDGDWSEFTPAQRAAFAFARKLTYEPHRITDADIDALRKHYKDLQILEMVLSVAGNNSINRWKEGCGVPQSRELGGFLRNAEKPADPDRVLPTKSFLTPTPEKYKDRVTKVAPLSTDEKTGKPSRLAVCSRPPLESRADVEKALEACRKRTPRLPLLDEEKARAVLPDDWPKGALPQWARLLANFPRDGKGRILALRAGDEKGDLKPLLKARVSWIIARQDRAWYAVGEARARLKQLGQSDDEMYRLDGDWADFEAADRALFTLARRLAASPVVLTDEDVARAVKSAGARDVVQLINYTTNRALFDRVTEAAGLRLEQ